MDINRYLQLMVDKKASDLFFSVGAPVNIKIEGVISAIGDHPLPPGSVSKLAYSLMNEKQTKTFESTFEMNLAVTYSQLGRFRINIYKQRGEVSMVVRYIRPEVQSLDKLNLPPILKDIIMQPRGLILMVGSTGSGKSTTLAAMINHRNENTPGHILTIEDPIEYMHKHKQCIVDQREIGVDTLSYENALKNAMREAPDVILIGEIRDVETMQSAIAYADTGHLCLSTLHANNSAQTIERIINFYPSSAQAQVYMDLAVNLRAVISQRLVTGNDGRLLPAVEILLNTPYVAELIQKGELVQIQEAMKQSNAQGMQTFDDSLYNLYQMGMITEQEALFRADSRTNLGLKIRLEEGGKKTQATENYSFD